MFLRNTAGASGGGIAIDDIRGINLTIILSQTEFRYNSAEFGGATHTSHIKVYYDKCTFRK